MTDKVLPFPQLSDVDKEWLELEKQQKIIREQAKRIVKKE